MVQFSSEFAEMLFLGFEKGVFLPCIILSSFFDWEACFVRVAPRRPLCITKTNTFVSIAAAPNLWFVYSPIEKQHRHRHHTSHIAPIIVSIRAQLSQTSPPSILPSTQLLSLISTGIGHGRQTHHNYNTVARLNVEVVSSGTLGPNSHPSQLHPSHNYNHQHHPHGKIDSRLPNAARNKGLRNRI